MKRIAAIEIFLSALCAGQENPRLEFALGALAESRGDLDESATRFENARLADPTALPLVRRAVAARLDAGDRAAAVRLFRELSTARANDLGIQLAYADFLQEHAGGDSLALQMAEKTLLAVLVKNPGDPEIIGRLHRIYQSSERQDEAQKLLDQLAPEDPASALLFASLSKNTADASDAAQRARLDEHYLTALKANPENATLARDASEHFRNSKQLDKAIDVLERHVAAAPSSLELRTRLGVLHLSAKHDEQGVQVLKEILEINPQQSLAHQSLAKFYRSHDQPEPARFHAGELLKIQGGAPADFTKLADEWLAAGNPREARLLLERAVYDHPGKWELNQKLAIAARRDPETRDTAAKLFREAESSRPAEAPAEPAFLVEFAEALLSEGQSKAAEERLRLAIRGYPPEAKKETAATLRRLASIWETENRNTDAARALRLRADALDR